LGDNMSGNGHLRASDADRELVAERLRTAATEGRIATDELDERLGATLSARTYGELEAVISDLPGTGTHPARRRPANRTLTVARVALLLAIVVPLMMVLLFVLTGLIAGWMFWMVAGWWFFGRHNHRQRRAGYGGARHIHRHAGAGPERGYRV
jgi:hypothetical protein